MATDQPPAPGPLRGEVVRPQGAPRPVGAPVNPLALVSLVLGIVAVVVAMFGVMLSFACFGFLAGLPVLLMGPAAAVVGMVGLRQVNASGGRESGGGFAVAGIATGSVATAIGLLLIVLMVLFMGLFVFAGAANGMEVP